MGVLTFSRDMRSCWIARMLIGLSLIFALLFAAGPAWSAGKPTILGYAYDPDAEVDVELILAVDISQSMDRDEQEVQRAGYVAALTSPQVVNAIRYGPLGRIAVSYLEWGGVGEHYIVADWAVISDGATAAAFAARIAEAPRHHRQRTSIASALAQAMTMIAGNRYQGIRKVIDISGDGPNNQGGAVTEFRDRAIANGITINGLPLMLKSAQDDWQAMMHIDHYYEDCVIGGPGHFSVPVRSKEQFANAIRMKLMLEIAGLSPNTGRIMTAAMRRPINCSLYD